MCWQSYLSGLRIVYCLGPSTSKGPASQPLGYMKPQNEEIYFVGNVEKKGKSKKAVTKSSFQHPSSSSEKSHALSHTKVLPLIFLH